MFLVSKQNITTQAKKAEELIASQVVYVKATKMVGNDMLELGVENEI
jgi:hypothetical protein